MLKKLHKFLIQLSNLNKKEIQKGLPFGSPFSFYPLLSFNSFVFICAMKKLIFLTLCVIFGHFASAQKKMGQSSAIYGPMLGYVTFQEANVWLQIDGIGLPILQYWDVNNEKAKKIARSTEANDEFNIFKFKLDVEPGHSYRYRINMTVIPIKEDSLMKFTVPELWRHRKDAPDLRIAFGSCHYYPYREHDRPGNSYGDIDTDIFNRIADKNPDMMFWMGDNIYLREPDWGSKNGIYNRYRHMRSNPYLDRLLRKCPNYAVWDDHDFGPNDANSSFMFKDLTLQAFHDNWCNPSNGNPDFPGITSWFEQSDAQFFLLDDRYYRTVFPKNPAKHTLLGQKQLDWLKLALLSAPTNDFKIVCLGSQFLNTSAVHENYSNWPLERNEIIDWIKENKIKNVIFLSGDRHHSELSVLKIDDKLSIYDFTSSPLTSGLANTKESEANTLRVAGSFYNAERNFGMLNLRGPANDRYMDFILYDKFGKEIWKYSFKKGESQSQK